MRIRSFGILANRSRRRELARCQELLDCPASKEETAAAGPSAEPEAPIRCPHCAQGAMTPAGELPPPTVAELVALTYAPQGFDSS